MLAHKRKRPVATDDISDSGASSPVEQAFSDDEIDISSALTGKKKARTIQQGEDSDDELNDLIQKSIAKRDIKGGTDVVKKAKGKSKLTKGELGGGSFQSMGGSQGTSVVLKWLIHVF